MLNYELQHDKGILVLHPEGALEAADFISITGQVDTYLAGHGKLLGVLICAKSFPGWKDFAAMLAHLRFLKEHIQKIEKVAVVADGALANTASPSTMYARAQKHCWFWNRSIARVECKTVNFTDRQQHRYARHEASVKDRFSAFVAVRID